MKKALSILLILTTLNLAAQDKKEPEPYTYDEFPSLTHDIRRASIVFCGSFPLMYMYSSIATDSLMNQEGFYSDKTDSEKVEFKILTSLILSGIVMIIDLIIEKFFKGK